MANNIALGQQLPAGVFDPNPDPATLPRNLVMIGIYMTSSAILSALSFPPHFAVALNIYIAYIIFLALIALFGVGMILIGWMVADAPDTHAALGRTALRASQILLVFAVALHEFATTSTTPSNAPTK